MYRINPADRITVNVFTQTVEGGWKILPSVCLLKQGKSPCSGNPLHPCGQKFSGCNAKEKSVCMDEVGRLEKLGKLPGNIKMEWAKFARESWSIKSFVRAQSFKFDDKTQQFVFDEARLQQLTIKFLLKEWSLGLYDSELVIQDGVVPGLQFIPGVPARGISDEQMARIADIDGDLMDAFLAGYKNSSRGILKDTL